MRKSMGARSKRSGGLVGGRDHRRRRLFLEPLENRVVMTAGISIADASVQEGQTANFSVTLSAPAPGTVTVNFSTMGMMAQAGSDFQSASGTLTFAPGETSKNIPVVTLSDSAVESSETFQVS